jgi:hypothetical protein
MSGGGALVLVVPIGIAIAFASCTNRKDHQLSRMVGLLG